MRRDGETGEFELVLGNGQLLSGLFIVVLLFAVFFALGYVVGQNSPRSAKLSDATQSTDRPQPVTTPPSTTPGAAASKSTASPFVTSTTLLPARRQPTARRIGNHFRGWNLSAGI